MRKQQIGYLFLWLLLFVTAIQFGAGVYERLIVIPQWSETPQPATLGASLQASGHTVSAHRFWPFVSPVVFVLALANCVLAWRHRGPARTWWLSGALSFTVISIVTYAYFVPTMLSLMHDAASYTEAELRTTVEKWVALSSGRSLLAIPAWAACARAQALNSSTRSEPSAS